MNAIAVEGMILITDDPTVVCTMSITGQPSLYSKIDGKGIYPDGTTISITNVTVPSAGATIPDAGPITGSFESLAIYVKDELIEVLLEGDKTGIITATPKIPSGSIPYPVNFRVEIQYANQNKVKAE